MTDPSVVGAIGTLIGSTVHGNSRQLNPLKTSKYPVMIDLTIPREIKRIVDFA